MIYNPILNVSQVERKWGIWPIVHTCKILTLQFSKNYQAMLRAPPGIGDRQEYKTLHYMLHVKWPRYFLLPLVPKGGGSMEPPLRKPLSHRNFAMKFAPYMYGLYKNHNSAKKIFKCCSVSKWRPNNRLLCRVILILAKFWKTTFPKEFFNEIWLKEGEYE